MPEIPMHRSADEKISALDELVGKIMAGVVTAEEFRARFDALDKRFDTYDEYGAFTYTGVNTDWRKQYDLQTEVVLELKAKLKKAEERANGLAQDFAFIPFEAIQNCVPACNTYNSAEEIDRSIVTTWIKRFKGSRWNK